jgi:hypothetical protein
MLLISRVIAATAGLFLLWLSFGIASSFSRGHGGRGGYLMLAGAVAAVVLLLAVSAFRRRSPGKLAVLLAGLAGSWAPIVLSAVYVAVSPKATMPIEHLLIFWLMWAGGGIITFSAPIGLWLLWLAARLGGAPVQRAA